MNRELNERRIELGVSDEVAAIEGLDPAILVALGENEVKTLDDLGDLAGDELIEMLGDMAPSIDEANAVIMLARAHWFEDDEEAGRWRRRPTRPPRPPPRSTRERTFERAGHTCATARPRPDAGFRRCIASGVSRPREALLRFVVDPGRMAPWCRIWARSLPGRGLWVSAERAALTKACERGLFARAARRPIAVAPDLIDEVEAAIDRTGAGYARVWRGAPAASSRASIKVQRALAGRGAGGGPGRGERRRAARPGAPRRARAGHSRDRAIRRCRVEPQPGP